MKESKISVKIEEDGSISINAEGFSGDACLKEIDSLMEDLLPVRVVKRKKDYGQEVKVANRVGSKLGGGR